MKLAALQAEAVALLRPTILLIDDDEEVRGALAQVLEDEGFHPLCAGSGAEAEAHARASFPSLVLLDYRLATDSALGVATRLRAHCGSALPIVLISGLPDLVNVAREVGVVATLPKPFGVDQLLRCIQQHSPLPH